MPDKNFHHVSSPKKLSELAYIISAQLIGDDSLIIHDVAPLDQADQTSISFLDNIKYKDNFKNTKAAACIIADPMKDFAPANCSLLIVSNPYKAYALIAQTFYPEPQFIKSNFSPQALIAPSAKIGNNVKIDAFAVIEDNVKIGDGCWIEAGAIIKNNVVIGKHSRIGCNAVVSHAFIGSYSRLYPNVSVGQDGFGFAIDPAGHVKVPQLGRVIIGDHVEIGANSCIDRGAGPDTIIGDGTWIDNCVQIGHNVKIGRGCVLVAQSGVAGSTILEDYVVLAAKAGIAGHLKIGTGSRIAAMSGIMHDLEPKSEVMGYPALPIKQFFRQIALLKKLSKPEKKD